MLKEQHIAGKVCIEAFVLHCDKLKTFRDIKCLVCKGFIHPGIRNRIRRIKPKMEELIVKSNKEKIDGYAMYPIPADFQELNAKRYSYEMCVYSSIEYYYDKRHLIPICQNQHFAQLCELKSILQKGPNQLCPKCNQPVKINSSLESLAKFQSN